MLARTQPPPPCATPRPPCPRAPPLLQVLLAALLQGANVASAQSGVPLDGTTTTGLYPRAVALRNGTVLVSDVTFTPGGAGLGAIYASPPGPPWDFSRVSTVVDTAGEDGCVATVYVCEGAVCVWVCVRARRPRAGCLWLWLKLSGTNSGPGDCRSPCVHVRPRHPRAQLVLRHAVCRTRRRRRGAACRCAFVGGLLRRGQPRRWHEHPGVGQRGRRRVLAVPVRGGAHHHGVRPVGARVHSGCLGAGAEGGGSVTVWRDGECLGWWLWRLPLSLICRVPSAERLPSARALPSLRGAARGRARFAVERAGACTPSVPLGLPRCAALAGRAGVLLQ